MLFRFAIFVGLGSVVATIIYFTPVPGKFMTLYFIFLFNFHKLIVSILLEKNINFIGW